MIILLVIYETVTGKRTHSCLCLYQAIRLGCSFKLFGVGGFGALARWSGIVPFSGIVADRQKGLGCVGFGGGDGGHGSVMNMDKFYMG